MLLALAVVFSALAVEIPTGGDLHLGVIPIVLYLVAQMAITLWPVGRRRSTRIDTVRLLLAVGAVLAISLRTGEVVVLPLFGLFIPIVAMAAAIGWWPTAIVSSAALGGFAIVVRALGQMDPAVMQRGITFLAAMVVLVVIGTRRTVTALERSVAHGRAAMAGQRRRGRQMAAVEEVGRMLAANGPSAAAMDDVMELLVSRFGYRYFVAVLDGTNLDEARRVANDVGRELESAPLEGADGEMLRATVSAGCASLGPDVASFETLLEVADVGLQMAKRGGRNRVVAA